MFDNTYLLDTLFISFMIQLLSNIGSTNILHLVNGLKNRYEIKHGRSAMNLCIWFIETMFYKRFLFKVAHSQENKHIYGIMIVAK